MGMDLGKIIHKTNYKATFLLYQILPCHILSPNLGRWYYWPDILSKDLLNAKLDDSSKNKCD